VFAPHQQHFFSCKQFIFFSIYFGKIFLFAFAEKLIFFYLLDITCGKKTSASAYN